MLNKIEVLEKPTEARADIHMTLTPRCQSGNDVLHIEHLAKSFDDLSLFQDISMDIKRGEHVAIIGDNGTGKTTILKIINDLVPADSGTIPVQMYILATTIRSIMSCIRTKRFLTKFLMSTLLLPVPRSVIHLQLFCLPVMMYSN